MHQGISDLIHHGTIQFSLFTGHIQFHLLIQLFGQIADHSGELHNNTLNRYHSYLHHGFVEIRGNILQVFNLLIESSIVALVAAGCRYQRVLCNDQFTYQIHQGIQFFNIHTYGTVHYRLIYRLLLRSLGCSRRFFLFLLRLCLDFRYDFLFLLYGFGCLFFGMIILRLLQLQNTTGYLCNLGYALGCLDDFIQRIIG